LGNRRSIALLLVIVLVVVLAGLVGAELLFRHIVGNKVASAVACEVQDSATVSFASMPPMLWQYATSKYPDISVQTAGNQVRSAKGMKVSIHIKDLRLSDTNNSKGTIGALNGTITWSSDGIKQSIKDALPGLGSFVAGNVTTNSSDGTVELKGFLDSATVKPQIANNGLALQVVNLTALGSKMSTDTVQKKLDSLTSQATQNYPLGIHADTVKVTDTGVEATFSTANATIPASSSSQTGQDCFSDA
jgi:LmeA-like phospholipid-binding